MNSEHCTLTIMPTRARDADLAAAAATAIESALLEIGAEANFAIPAKLEVTLPNGRTFTLAVFAASIIDATKAAGIVTNSEAVTIVVADLIGAAARSVLGDAGISWLDRRGHLRISAPDVWIDRDIEPLPRVRRNDGDRLEITGAASFAVAAGHLVDADVFGGVRPLARLTGLSPSAISQARRPLIDRGMLTDDPDARTELFWALAAAWRPDWHVLASTPSPADGVVASGTRAAAALGAPIVATDSYPLELHAGDVGALERVRLRAGTSTNDTPARISVAPNRLVILAPQIGDRTIDGHPIAHPLFVALDLAADPARGAEALADWSPEGWTRAW